MTGTSTSIWPDSFQLTRIFAAFPGRHVRYLPGNVNPETGTVDVYYCIIEGDPEDPEQQYFLSALIREIGDIAVELVLGGPDWSPP